MAAREKLDNLIFVVQLQSAAPGRSSTRQRKIIQELEGVFRGAGWNVIKVIWGPTGIRCLPATPTVCCVG